MLSDNIRREKVGVCVSGGLSSLTVVAALADAGVEAIAFIADIGQADQDNIRAVAGSLEAAGVRAVVVDLRDDMARLGLDLVRYGARYDGGYWNTTGASRLVLAEGLGGAMQRAGCTVLAHGCVGGGNDQRRFERYAAVFTPGMRVFAPWTEPELVSQFPNRSVMQDYVLGNGLIAGAGSRADYSVDGNLAGFSHEGDALERLETSDRAATPFLTVLARQACDEPGLTEITFDRGHLAGIDGVRASPRELLEHANAFGGRHGIGLRSVVENRINGTKCRGVYEAPGLDLLGYCLRRVLELTLDREAQELLRDLSLRIGRSVYEGRYCGLTSRAARAGACVLLESASGTVRVEGFKGGLLFAGMRGGPGPLVPARQTRFNGGGHVWQTAQ